MLMWMTANKIQLLQHPPDLPDLAPEAYFFFWGVKEGAGWRCLDSGELQEDLGRGRPNR
jgi:hypothetical protein